MEFLKANGIEDHSFVKEMDYQEVLNSQEIFGDELAMFARKELQKEVSGRVRIFFSNFSVCIVLSSFSSEWPQRDLKGDLADGDGTTMQHKNIS